jgi:hypothetical protein
MSMKNLTFVNEIDISEVLRSEVEQNLAEGFGRGDS